MLENKFTAKLRRHREGHDDFLPSFDDLVKIFNRRKNGIYLGLVLGAITALGYHFIKTPEYYAVSNIMINDYSDKSRNDLFSKVVGPEPGMTDNSKSVKKDAELLKSMNIAEITIRTLVRNGQCDSMELFNTRKQDSPFSRLTNSVFAFAGGEKNSRNWYSDEEIRRYAIKLNERIRVDPLRETNVIKVSVASPYPDEAANLTNTLCRVYKDIDIDQHSEKYTQVYGFISKMLDKQSEKLAKADKALSGYMSNNEIYEESGNTALLLQKLVEVESQYNDLKAEYNIVKNNLDFLNRKLSQADRELSVRISQNVTAQLGSIMDEVKENENDYVKIVKSSGVESPEAQAQKQKLDIVKTRYEQLSRSKIAGQIGYIGSSQKYSYDVVSEKLQMERKLDNLSFAAREYDNLKKHYERQLNSLPVKQQEYIKLQRDREAISKTYVFLKEKLDESRILIGSEVGNVSIIGKAFQPLKPETPNAKNTLLFGLVFGGALAGLYTFAAETLDKTVKDISYFRGKDIAYVKSIPFVYNDNMGVVSPENRVRDYGYSEKILNAPVPVINDLPLSTFAESMRGLRAYIDHVFAGHDNRCIVVAGSVPHEGSSTICANLGITHAQAGYKTLIVDCDMQHAYQHMILNRDRNSGLSDVILGDVQLTDPGVIENTGITNLFFMSAGQLVDNSSELLGSKKMYTLVPELKAMYDIILFDCPPVSQSDTISVSGLSDGVVLVSRLGLALEKVIDDLAVDEFYASRIVVVAVIDPLSSSIDKVDNLRSVT